MPTTISADSLVEVATRLFSDRIPANTRLAIEETDGRLIAKYIIRLTYTSHKSGRQITVTTKGDTLPSTECPLMHFYLNQIVLNPIEVGREFSRIYFLEKRARQEAFLFSKDNIRVSVKESEKDKLNYKDYA